MVVRPAGPDDDEAVLGLRNALIATTAVEWTSTPHTMEGHRGWRAKHPVVLVAEVDGEVVGFAAYGDFRDSVERPGYRFCVENSVHVREGFWGTGVGRRLMEALIEAARAAGMHVMVAAVDGANEGSIRFHERLGFERVGHLRQVGAKFGRWLDLVLLQCDLDDREAPPPD